MGIVSLRRVPGGRPQARGYVSPAFAQDTGHGKEHVQHGLLADIRLSPRLGRLSIAIAKALAVCSYVTRPTTTCE